MINSENSNNFNYLLNGLSVKKIIIYLVVASVFFIGLSYRKHHLNYYDDLAAKKFHIMTYSMINNDAVTVDTYGKELLSYSDRTPYPRLAAIFLAKMYIQDNKFDQAIEKLELVINKSKNKSRKDFIWHIANLRLIKVLLMQSKLDEAVKYLNKGTVDQQFASRYHELQGDLLLLKNDKEAANLEYAKALQGLPQQTIAPWIDLKIADL